MSVIVSSKPRTLITLIDIVAPERLSPAITEVLRVAVGIALVAVLAQVAVPLPFTPVPLTGQTLGVLLCGMALGSRRGGVALLTYLLLGGIGLPIFAGWGHGSSHLIGPTAGYLLGFPLAAALVGRLSERGWDRRPLTAALSLALGSLLILCLGSVWLSLFVGGIAAGFTKGMLPFLPIEAIKIALAAGLLPLLWHGFSTKKPG